MLAVLQTSRIEMRSAPDSRITFSVASKMLSMVCWERLLLRRRRGVAAAGAAGVAAAAAFFAGALFFFSAGAAATAFRAAFAFAGFSAAARRFGAVSISVSTGLVFLLTLFICFAMKESSGLSFAGFPADR